ncbi:MAG: tetratricopeptide repeat protein [Marine Group I thaumarchaeote]|nr:MAG: tetratricopeptide repeat protein [Marine Group I thaumarchaeote]
MKKLFSKKTKPEKIEKQPRMKKETSLTDADYNRKKLFKQGINLMADEKLDDAAIVFEQALRIDPNNVETLLKLGYALFHLEDHAEALKVYDKILDIDVTNAEAWNLKALVHYEQKNYSKALDGVEKAIESDPTYGMAWYNKACFFSLLNQIPESIEALKRSIEIDVKNARKAVKDRDFVNLRVEEGFKRIIEVVVLESIRQGYHTIGAIVWTTFLDKSDTEDALRKLSEKGLIVKNEKREGFHRIPIYDLVQELVDKVGTEQKSLLGIKMKKLPGVVKNLKQLSHAIQAVKSSIEEEDVEKTIDNFEPLIDPTKYGQEMIEQFFEEHREIRLWKIRLKDRGLFYLQDNKQKMLNVFDNIEVTVTKQLRSEITPS